MIRTIYLETDVENHPRTISIIKRYPNAQIIPIKRYGEVFNRVQQNFKIQKNNPALILAKKEKNFVLKAPIGYGLGSSENYYFSHMLNCLYDCRYCFLQGMYRSANYIIFVNFEDFTQAIIEQYQKTSASQQSWFFSGYDCDSLAFEPVTGFIAHCLETFKRHPQANLEIRTKSTQIRTLMESQALNNIVVAFSFTPENFSDKYEKGVPSVKKRLQAMEKLQSKGWQIGLRFDPVMHFSGYQQHYEQLFDEIFERLNLSLIHSISVGKFRMPIEFFKKMKKIYPQEPLFHLPMEKQKTQKTTMLYAKKDDEAVQYCQENLLARISKNKLFDCSF